MKVYDTSLIRIKTAFQNYRSPAGDIPTDVRVRQYVTKPHEVHVKLTYPDRTEELVVS